MKGLVLAAGLGTRLHPLTRLRAKPAVPLHNRPLVRHAVELLRRSGVDRLAVNTHHLPDTVHSALADCEGITYSHEPEILGRGGALKKLAPFLRGDTFVVCNGKIYLEGDLKDVIERHRAGRAVVTLVLVEWSPASPFNPVLLEGGGRIAGFGLQSAPSWEDRLRPATFTGIHIVEPELLDRLPEGRSDTVGDLYPRLIDEGAGIRGEIVDNFWCESSTLDRYLDNSVAILRRRGLAGISESGRLFAGSVVGQGCHIAEDARLSDCILWDGVTVESGARLSRVIVTGNARVPARRLSDVVVTPAGDDLLAAAGPEVEQWDEVLIWPIPKA